MDCLILFFASPVLERGFFYLCSLFRSAALPFARKLSRLQDSRYVRKYAIKISLTDSEKKAKIGLHFRQCFAEQGL
ncbi:MAG: hypothetical protein A2X58_03210 [Nitrospirae bacterium GWC2_56_14]|nr:MAG: hypothetical protein A2X58_03210 [Nitrospirae bacterium GWC2_56_14]